MSLQGPTLCEGLKNARATRMNFAGDMTGLNVYNIDADTTRLLFLLFLRVTDDGVLHLVAAPAWSASCS